MNISIGAGPIGWFEDDFSAFRNDVAREAHLTALARAGFNGISLNPATAREVAAVHAALARHRLAFIAPTHAISLLKQDASDTFAQLQMQLRAARALGATEVSVCERSSIAMTDADWTRFGDRLSDLARHFTEAGLRLVYRPAPGTIVGTPEAVDRLMTVTQASVALLLDAALLGDEAISIARRHASRIAIVAPESATDAVMAELPGFTGWTMLDEHAGHAPERVEHLHEIADVSVAA